MEDWAERVYKAEVVGDCEETSRHSRAATHELAAFVTPCTEPVRVRARPNPNVECIRRHKTPHSPRSDGQLPVAGGGGVKYWPHIQERLGTN